MFVPFESISESSKIWIYQANRKLTASEVEKTASFLKEYCESWKAHGMPLKASFEIKFQHFIILAADESFNATSGCSVDDSVRAIKMVESDLGLDFFNRNLIAFNNGGEVQLLPLNQLKENFVNGMWNQESLTFNNLVDSKSKLGQWIVPAGETWLKRYIPAQNVHS